MNFAGHVEVVRPLTGLPGDPVIADRPGLFLGAVLPDLAAMGRFRLQRRPGDDLGTGVDLHHRTDDAFHRHPWFRRASGAVTSQLDRAGLPRGASRACGHVGVELLLDGHLLDRRPALRPAVEAAMTAAGERLDGLSDLVDPDRRDEWRRHLERLAAWPIPEDYHHPMAVAERLERILRRRPRLALPAADVAAVAQALDGQRAAVATGADRLIADLQRELAEESSAG